MKKLLRISDILDKACGFAVTALLFLMTATYSAQIVMRYALGTGVQWTEELTRFAGVWAIMIGAAMIAKRRSHINVSVLEELLRGKSKTRLLLVQQILSLVFFTGMFVIAFDFIRLAGSQVTTNMRIPKAWVYWVFPPAFGAFVYQTFVGILLTAEELKA